MHSTDACAVSEGQSHGCRKGNALMKTSTHPNCEFNQLGFHFENEEPELHSEVHEMNADWTVQKVIVLSFHSSVATIFTSLYVLFYCIWLYWKTLWWNPLKKCSRNPFHVVVIRREKGFSSCSVEWLQPYITGARMKWPEVDLSRRKLALTWGNAFNLRKSWVRVSIKCFCFLLFVHTRHASVGALLFSIYYVLLPTVLLCLRSGQSITFSPTLFIHKLQFAAYFGT